MVTLQQIGNKLTIICFLFSGQDKEEKYVKKKVRNAGDQRKIHVIHTTTLDTA